MSPSRGSIANLRPLRVAQAQLTPFRRDTGMSQVSVEQKFARRRRSGARGAAAPVFLNIISQPERRGRTNWNAILQLRTNKLMNDNGLLIEATGAIPSADCGAANGVLRVVMATGVERL